VRAGGKTNILTKGGSMKKIAVLEVEFESDDMWDQESLEKEMDGDWLKAMTELFDSDGIGIFDNDLILVAIKEETL